LISRSICGVHLPRIFALLKTYPKVIIPARYLFKLLVELILLALSVFFYTISDEWLADFKRLGPVIHVLVRFFVYLFGISVVVRLLAIVYRQRKHLPYSKKDNVTLGLSNVSIMLIAIFTIISIFGLLGLSPGQIFTSLSIVAAAFAILSKDFISDIISGIVIAFSKELSIDDFVQIGGQRGRIIDINITKTALLNEDDDIVFIPNNKVFSSEIINLTKKQIKKTTIDFEVPMGAINTVEELEDHLIRSLAEYHHLIEPNSYVLRVEHIMKDYLHLKFQYSLIQFSRQMERQIKDKAVRFIVKQIYQGKSFKLKSGN
jgi:small-conductance mechanosensitive channel